MGSHGRKKTDYEDSPNGELKVYLDVFVVKSWGTRKLVLSSRIIALPNISVGTSEDFEINGMHCESGNQFHLWPERDITMKG